jgi:hypothetical protein
MRSPQLNHSAQRLDGFQSSTLIVEALQQGSKQQACLPPQSRCATASRQHWWLFRVSAAQSTSRAARRKGLVAQF